MLEKDIILLKQTKQSFRVSGYAFHFESWRYCLFFLVLPPLFSRNSLLTNLPLNVHTFHFRILQTIA